MTEHRRAAVAAMLCARSMAVVGASDRPDSFGARMALEAQRGSARVHLVNPRYDRIGGLPCAPSLADLDERVDVVLLGVPDTALVEQLFHMRPAPGYADYRTPISGLYNGSSATHAGGGVCGIPGWQAARAALADQKRGLRRLFRG